MPLLLWSNQFITDIRAIDQDHRMLVDIVNTLFDDMQADEACTACARNLDALIRYTQEHFKREEKFMEAGGYPHLASHMRQHERLTQSIHRLRAAYRADPEALRAADVWVFLRRWLGDHIVKSDMDYVPYLKGDKAGAPRGERIDALKAVTVRVPADKVDLLFRCSAMLLDGGKAADQLAKLVAAGR